MKGKLNFYLCRHCGNIIIKIEDSGVNVVCCGEDMILLIPNNVDTSAEKHVPVVEVNSGVVTVTVGSELHPMTKEHHIAWIVIETETSYQIKYLDVVGEPKVVFKTDEKVLATYEYCNIHGLWVK